MEKYFKTFSSNNLVYKPKRFNFFGNTKFYKNHHNGNVLGIIKLLIKFDSFIKEHLNNYWNIGSGTLILLYYIFSHSTKQRWYQITISSEFLNSLYNFGIKYFSGLKELQTWLYNALVFKFFLFLWSNITNCFVIKFYEK